MQELGTYLSGFDAAPVQRIAAPHWAAVRSTDVRGPRMFVVSPRTYRMLRRGQAPHGHAAMDEFGEVYEYDATRDLWAQGGTPAANIYRYQGYEFPAYSGFANTVLAPYGQIGKRLKRWGRKIGKGIRRVVKRVGQAVRFVGRKVIAPILQSKWAQRAIGAALQAVGIPRRLTAGIMAAAGQIVKKVGVVGLIKMIRKDRKNALRILAAAGKAGLRAAARPLGNLDQADVMQHWITQRGVQFPAQHVMGFVPAPGVFGAYELVISDTPEPGRWYRIQKGDTLFGVTSKAYGVKAGSERLSKARWIANAAANAFSVDPSLTDRGLFPNGRPDFLPRYACDPAAAIEGTSGRCFAPIWIPEAAGDEPAEKVEEPTGPEPALPTLLPEEPEPPMPPPTAEEMEPVPPPEPEPVAEPAPPPPEPVAPPQPPVALTPAPEIMEPVAPTVEEPSAPPPMECPEWFRPSVSGKSCIPDLPCPAGMEWRSVAQGGPPPLGGCVALAPMPPSPEEPPEVLPSPIVPPPMPTPPPPPALTTPAYQPGMIPPAFPTRDELPPSPEEPPIPAPTMPPPTMALPPMQPPPGMAGGIPSWILAALLLGR